jgi:predicted alpha/beta hydrolase
VLVFDYRGIGQSLQGPLAQCQATLADWGQQDQVAALQWLLKHCGSPQALLLGHSAGGQMLGLLPNHGQVARMVGISASSGWFAAMRPGFAFQARLGLRVLMPLAARWLGYAPTSRIGLGENLPAGVARQWGEWCAAGRYATNAVRERPQQDFHAQVRTPITVLYAVDDDIANAATVQDLLQTWPGAPQQARAVRPADHGLRGIGHLNWFRQSHRALWPLMSAALQGSEPAEPALQPSR